MKQILIMVFLMMAVSAGTECHQPDVEVELPEYMDELLEDHPDFYGMSEKERKILVKMYTAYHWRT